tara:strand:+ start:284 stop:2428 length:2145 start_codon:yes stop_codon:yes gene_type:complete
MAKMAEQMELFEPVERGFDEGGLMDEGGTTDPVSGNEVPPGSTQEEVRDDIPAQLSEGEFVFPADVVRYIGLEKLMIMRQEAKQGLAQMEAMGQMGNSEQAVMPDNLPFDMYDLDIEDDGLEMQAGGYVPPPFIPQQPVQPQMPQVDPRTGTYQLSGSGISGYLVPPATTTGYTPYGGVAPVFQPTKFTGTQFQTATGTSNIPTFAETVGSKVGQYDEIKTFINDAGQTIQIPFKDGKPLFPIPEGYRPIGDEPKAEDEIKATVDPTLGQAQVTDGDDRDKDGRSPGASVAWGGTTEGVKEGLKTGSTPVEISFDTGGIPSVPTMLGFAASLATGKEIPDGVTVGMSLNGVKTEMPAEAYNTAKKDGFMGSYSDTLLDVAKTNVAAVSVLEQKYGIVKYDMNQTLEEIAGRAARSDAAIAELAETYGFDVNDVKNNPFGLGKSYDDAVAKAVEAANSTQSYVDAFGQTQTFTPTSKFTANDIKAGHKARTAINARNQALEEIAKAKNASGQQTTAQQEQAKQDAALAKSGAAKGSGMKSEAEATAQSEAFEKSQDDGSGRGPGGGSAPGDPSGGAGLGSGTDCLTENMKVKLNGVVDFVTNIKVGDMIDGSVVKEVLHKHMRSGYFVINNELEITNDHPVWAKSGGLGKADWTRPEQLVIGDTINGVKVTSLNYIDRMTPTVSIVIDGDSFDVYTGGNTYTVHGRYREVRQQAA